MRPITVKPFGDPARELRMSCAQRQQSPEGPRRICFILSMCGYRVSKDRGYSANVYDHVYRTPYQGIRGMMLQQARSSGVTYQVSLFGRTRAHALNHKCPSHVGDLTDALHQTCS